MKKGKTTKYKRVNKAKSTKVSKAKSKTKLKVKSPKNDEKLYVAQFSMGIAFCLFAALLMVTDWMTISIRIAIAIVGIFLIATSPFSPLKI